MLPLNDLDRIQVAFDDHRLVDNAGLLLLFLMLFSQFKNRKTLQRCESRWSFDGAACIICSYNQIII